MAIGCGRGKVLKSTEIRIGCIFFKSLLSKYFKEKCFNKIFSNLQSAVNVGSRNSVRET